MKYAVKNTLENSYAGEPEWNPFEKLLEWPFGWKEQRVLFRHKSVARALVDAFNCDEVEDIYVLVKVQD